MNELPMMRAKARRCTFYQLRLCVGVLVLILLSKQFSEYIQFHQSLTIMTPVDIHAHNAYHNRQKVDNSSVRQKEDLHESGFDKISNELYELASAKYGNETNIHKPPSSYGTVNDEKMEKVFLQIFNVSDFKVQNKTILDDIYTSSSSVFEYGIGESTKIASANCVARYTGIDEKAKLITTLRNSIESTYFRFQYAMRTNSVQLLYDFVMTPLILERNAFDIYFVNLDRVGVDVGFSCIVASILHALKHKAVDRKSSRLVVYTTKFKDQENMMKLIGKVFSSHMTFNDMYGKITIQQNEANNILKNLCFKFLMEKYGFLPKDISKYISQEENGFDTMSSILYDKVSSHFSVTRKPFDLISWHRQNKTTTGGLKATDRKLIGSMYSTKESIFEYGLGESTYIASHVNVPRYKGTDSDTTWISNVQKHAPDHFRFFFSDIGEILEWGKPANVLFKSRFNYQIAPLIVERKPFELYLIDGRYRIGCFCVSFLHAFKYGANMTTVRVAVHDNHRKQYHKAHSTVANVVMRAEELWVYALKETTTENDLYRLWKKYGSEIL